MKTILKVEGMSCGHCVSHVTRALEGVEGVNAVKVSLEKKSAEIDHADSVSVDSLKAVVVEEGYEIV